MQYINIATGSKKQLLLSITATSFFILSLYWRFTDFMFENHFDLYEGLELFSVVQNVLH